MRVDAVQIPDVVGEIQRWIESAGRCKFIAVTGMHGVTEAQRDPSFKQILNSANLVVPDGMPLVWLARRNGFPLERRVYGPELMETFCRETGARYKHFFYGGSTNTTEKLAEVLQRRYAINVAGMFSPPFRALAPEENAEIVSLISAAQPDILWVGLSTPKQEQWMKANRDTLGVPVAVGVGAAFDFLSGTKSMAPRWMQERGLEWFYRLSKEPRRLWRRYLVGGGRFVYWLLLEQLRLRSFD